MTTETMPPVEVYVKNFADAYAKPRVVTKTTFKTYVLDPIGANGVAKSVQICDYEPARLRMAIQVIDQPMALTLDPPNSSPDLASALIASTPLGTEVITPAPAAGAESVTVVPAGEMWTLESWEAVLTTNATVANRVIQLIIDDGAGNTFLQATGNVAQAAGLQIQYQGAAGVAENATVRAGNPFSYLQMEFPLGLVLRAGWRIRTLTTNIQAGDQWSAATIGIVRSSSVGSIGNTTPQGRLLPSSPNVYEFFGPDAMWLNTLTGTTPGRVTVTKEYC